MIWFGWVLWHINHCRLFNAKSYIYIKYIWFGMAGFYCISTIVGYLMPNPFCTYISNTYDLVWFGLVWWHINYYRLYNVESSLYIYITYIGFGLVGFYGISTIVGYLMPNPLYTYISNIYNLVWLGWVLWHCRLFILFLVGLFMACRLFNAKSHSYKYIRYIWHINTFCR